MSTQSAAQWAGRQLKRIAARQVKTLEPRRRKMLIRPTEQMRRFQTGEERWRVTEGLVTPEQYQRYTEAMERRLMEG